MELSTEQSIAFQKYRQGNNLFITGPGGSGKSALVRYIYDDAYSRFKNIQVTALTGCASVLLNCKAKTLHFWSGIGLGNGTTENIIKKVKQNGFAKKSWIEIDVLVIDEVSMLSLKLFEMLNEIGKKLRKNNKPFGGIQLICLGDFYQLPPVGNKDEPETQQFCFESEIWNEVFPLNCHIQLKKIFRQTDEIYSTILNQIREGKLKRKSNDILLEYVGRDLNTELVTEPTKLFPTKNKVEHMNNQKMKELSGDEKVFHIKYLTELEMTKTEKLRRLEFTEKDIQIELNYLQHNLRCDDELHLKIGAQVMCIVNMNNPDGEILVCNGSLGIVVSFCPATGFPRVKFNNGVLLVMGAHLWGSEKIPGIGISQVPLILAWALTIHKSQGATLDAAEIDVGSGIFECGQTYVALSRVKSLDGLYLTSFDVSRIRINKKVKKFYENLQLYWDNTTDANIVVAEPIDPTPTMAFIQNAVPLISNVEKE